MNPGKTITRLWGKVERRIKKRWLRPIHVFLFHQVSGQFDETTMKPGDWTQEAQFKENMLKLRKQYRFISFDEAYRKMRRDVFRMKDYAVLTADDGWASLKNILPWLKEQGIPVTLFLNPGYFDGAHFREKDTEKYLLQDDIDALASTFPLVTIASHGWDHTRATRQTEEEFRDSVRRSVQALESYPNYVPFFAYTYGSNSASTDRVLDEFGLVPVMIDKEANRDDLSRIHRELIDGIAL